LTLRFWKQIAKLDSLTLTLVTAFLLRLAIIPLLYDDYNYWAFGVFTNFLLAGNDPYHVVANDPTLLFINPWRYPPLYLAFTTPALVARTITGSTLIYLAALKIPLAIADVVSALYLYKILLLKFPKTTAIRFTALFAFNPLVIFESAGGGFNDPIPIAFTVISCYYLLAYRQQKATSQRGYIFRSAFFLGLGVVAKIYPLLLLPVFAREIQGSSQRLGYVLTALVPMVLVSAPFMTSDFGSYTSLLIVRSVGGQHPLIPFASLGGVIGPAVIAGLILVLLLTYLRNFGLMTRASLVFLWVNIAIFGQSLNYMIWGIPFFTILFAQNPRLRGTIMTAAVTFVTALIFQGWYSGTAGETGLYYWSYHLLHQEIVVFRTYPFSDIDSLVLVTVLLSASVLVNAFYFIRTARLNPQWPSSASPEEKLDRNSSKGFSWRRPTLVGAFCVLVLLSWSMAAIYASFNQHNYPIVQGSTFEFQDSFRTSLLNYQWASGGANYSINSSQGYLTISDSANSTGYVYRGWQNTIDGFHQSYSCTVSIVYRFEGFLPGRDSMVLVNMTDGILAAQQTQANSYFQYVDLVHNQSIDLSHIDSNWHNFTEQLSQGSRVIQFDGLKQPLKDGYFSKLVLGDFNPGGHFGGRAEFSNVIVIEKDFPSSQLSPLFGGTGLGVSFLVVIAGIVAASRRLSNLLGGVTWRRGARDSSI
jgi:hypothetical protein